MTTLFIYQPMDHRLHAFLGLTGLSYFWKMYILARNLINISFISAPPADMFTLREPATYNNLRIQDPLPNNGMNGSLAARMYESGTYDVDESVFAALRTATIQRDMTELYIMVYNFGVSMIKLSSGYYPGLWERTTWFSNDMTLRAMWFLIFDNVITFSWLVPLSLSKSTMTRKSELWAMIHMGFIRQSLKAFVVVQLVYSFSFLPENIRDYGWMMVAAGVFVAVLGLQFAVIYTLKETFPRARNDTVGAHLMNLARTVGFPTYNIIVGPRVDYPEARYCNVLCNQMLFYNPLLTVLCTTPEQVVAVVCHEFGRRRVCFWFLIYLSYFVELFGLSYCCMKTLGEPFYYNLFGFEIWDDLHPYILLYLTCIHVWPMLTEAASCCRCWMMYELELRADDYACSMGYPLSLMMAILVLAGTSFQYPVLDDQWYATYCLGVPTVQERLARIEERISFYDNESSSAP